MLYLYGAALTAIVFTVVYIMASRMDVGENDYDNIMEDVPTISVSKEALEKHALEISNFYSEARNSNCRRRLIKSLDRSYEMIIRVYEHIDNDVRSKIEVVPAAEWLLDNLYLIEKEYKDIKQNMPESYYKNLPVINRGIMCGYPRAYHIAVELVSHTDGRIDEKVIETFIRAYEKNTILTTGELWALPIMLRIALIQNISKITEKLDFAQMQKKLGDALAERLINAVNEEKLEEELKKLRDEKIRFSTHFVERLLKVLRDNGIDNGEIYRWVDEKLAAQESNTDKMITIEHQKQANFQLSIGNCVMSIREIEALNWRAFFEKVSLVEQILREDPADIYEKMDFESRDYYRHELEKLARRMNKAESFVAKKVVECANNAEGDSLYLRHVGFYIVDDGVEALKDKLGNSNRYSFLNMKKSKRVNYYIGLNIFFTFVLMSIVLFVTFYNDKNPITWKYIVAAFAIIIPCSEIVISIFNWSINHLVVPSFIPKMEFKNGIPDDRSTIVVIPTLINNVKRVHELINDIEIYYLANHERNLYFALLCDFKDSKNEHEEYDKEIIEAALKDIKALNDKYCKDSEDIFYFFSRYRQFNPKENKWLGWERKRGKLMEFNQLLRGNTNTSYNVISGDIKKLFKVKYVITLDADTQLPRECAKKLVGAMSHVLNEAILAKEKKEVLRGYGLMQPRVSVGTISANKTLFSKIFSGETGIDTYTTAVSDVYQDLFGEGIFTGKGIYNIDAFEYMIHGEIPENTVLSHDLLEGSYVRTALVTDLEFIDGYPAYYNSSAMRLHRWVRGDWQLLPWIFKKSSLNKLSKWKMIDNLRRSLLTPSIMTLLILSFWILPGSDRWLILAFLALLSPMLFDVSETVAGPIRGISLSGRIDNSKNVVEQVFLIFCFLPYTAYLMIDAIVRTLYRVFISRKNLLEWQTAADVENKLGRKFKNFISSMWMGSLIAILILVLAFYNSIGNGLFILPSCVLWFLSPIIAYYISQERKPVISYLNEEQKQVLRKLARKTWGYFEDLVNGHNNYLAPDNFQEDPDNGVATRTSPTNMGMGFTSNLTAYDLGYIGILEVVDRTDKILSSMESLEMYKGHFYNWYDTVSKEPLKPRYISTVDSGNLVGYLWITAEALKEYLSTPIINKNKQQGLKDTLVLANEEVEAISGIHDIYHDLISKLQNSEFDAALWKKTLRDIFNKVKEIDSIKGSESAYWNNKVKHSISKELEELELLFPWGDMVDSTNNLTSAWEKLREISLSLSIRNYGEEVEKSLKDIKASIASDEKEKEALEQVKTLIKKGAGEAEKVLEKALNLIDRLENMANNTEFSMLYDKKRQLFSIGYDIEKESLGNCYYDLLASESRQASFVAIAKGEVEQSHWFKLGRSMTVMDRSKGLVSWSGTMFEYFMPLLIMKNYPDTLLDDTYRAVINGQKRYGKEKKVPWGISESAFYHFDTALNYQYKAFGVPGIGLKRGLINELVISPYSTVMALQMDFQGAFDNIKRLQAEGFEGRYGFYEAIDYTKERLPKGKKNAVVKCFMVHHEGMSLMSLNNTLNNNILQERFHRIPIVKATELLLQERVPKRVVYDREQKFDVVDISSEKQNIVVRNYSTAKTESPETHLLSNGSYSVMISNSGSGYGKREDMTVYRWREDFTLDSSGMFFYIKNLNSNDYWSAAYEPCKDEGEDYQVVFSLDKAEFKRKDGSLLTHTEIAVSNEDNAEVRRISISNHGDHARTVEITSYCEVTLAPYNADIVHPTFSNLFIKTEYLDNPSCIIAARRPRAKGQKKPYVMQTVSVEGETVGTLQYETSRLNFIGRGRNLSNPLVMDNDAPLKNTVGAVLDPIISVRRRIKIHPGKTCIVAYTTAVAESKEQAVELARKYREMTNVNRVFELAWTQTQVEMKYLGIKSTQANLYQLMASKILFLNASLKEREAHIKNIRRYQSNLWSYGISGDLPIVLLIVKKESDIDYVRQLINAHEYWKVKGLRVDLVIINLQSVNYVQPLNDAIRDLISSSHARDKQNKPGGIFTQNEATMSVEDRELLMAIARMVIDPEKGSLLNQIRNDDEVEELEELLSLEKLEYSTGQYKVDIPNLEYFNEFGGFDLEKNQYVIKLRNSKNTPAPWINVMSNGEFGFHVSESGSAYTWYKNSRENKITPWSNDPIMDNSGEILYLRDEITGELWNITAAPIKDDGEYIIEHGFGYSTFKHQAHGIIGEVTMYLPMKGSYKVLMVKLKNNSSIQRRISLTYYAQLTLGVVPQQTAQYISTYLNEEKEYIYGRNPYSEPFGKGHVFLKVIGGEKQTFTGDRTEFIGRGGSISNPAALKRIGLSNITGAGLDPCLASMASVTLESNEESNLIVLFGEDEDINSVEKVIEEFKDKDTADRKLQEVKDYWRNLLGRIQVKTPDKSMDIILNGWLMYQTIVCRVWARTAFYQSGGAFGFRDQLQDVMAVSYLEPGMTKKQILYSASRQFLEGDVQHWWHPVVDSGIRTRFSDDLLWLPFVTIDYIKNTGDFSILDEEVGYLEDELLPEDEDERYTISRKSEHKGSIYEHCIKALDRGLKFGVHNIPLMGSGDWNDGMSTVGNKGTGESVWLGWFLYSILDNFRPLCKYKEDEQRLKKYEELREFIRENLEANAWDGGWYRRAYFDDGTPLGSRDNDECQIDSLSQSWAVISKAAKESRAKEAMEALEKHLLKEDIGLILLLTPAFNNSNLEPGYIKGYVPGVRENGAQYTHAAVWVVLALARMGYGDKAWKAFNMINPVNHAKSHLDCERYKVEPYVMTADVYMIEPHVGRGGWSWYTGAAGWMYRTGIEGILGLKIEGSKGFTIEPCIPDEWPGYEIEYTKDKAKYKIEVRRGSEKAIKLNGEVLEDNIVPFAEHGEHRVEVII